MRKFQIWLGKSMVGIVYATGIGQAAIQAASQFGELVGDDDFEVREDA